MNDNGDQVDPQWSTTSNRVFGLQSSDYTLVQLVIGGVVGGSPTPSPVQGFPTASPVAPTGTVPTTPSPFSSPTTTTPAPVNNEENACVLHVRSASNNAWHGGIDVGFDVSSVVLDFSNTGLDLNVVTPQQGAFASMTVVGNKIRLTKPSWMSKSNPGYLGMGGNNVPALGTFVAPSCTDSAILP